MAPESLPSPCTRAPSATGDIARCMQFCGKRSNFHLPVSCWMLFVSLISYPNITGARGQSSPPPRASRGGRGVLVFASVRPDVLASKSPSIQRCLAEGFLLGKLVWNTRMWFFQEGKPDSRTAINKWNSYLAWVICTSIVVKENVRDSSAFVFNF